jgi:hypothetical protein
MAWDFDYLDHESFFFRSDVDHLVVAVYKAAYSTLLEGLQTRLKQIETEAEQEHDEVGLISPQTCLITLWQS